MPFHAEPVFGFDQISWDGEGAWSWLSSEQQAAAAALGKLRCILPRGLFLSKKTDTSSLVKGYDEFSWNYEIDQAVDDKCWIELTSEEQDAAGVLGKKVGLRRVKEQTERHVSAIGLTNHSRRV